jgi:hypothetical protein
MARNRHHKKLKEKYKKLKEQHRKIKEARKQPENAQDELVKKNPMAKMEELVKSLMKKHMVNLGGIQGIGHQTPDDRNSFMLREEYLKTQALLKKVDEKEKEKEEEKKEIKTEPPKKTERIRRAIPQPRPRPIFKDSSKSSIKEGHPYEKKLMK